MKYMEDHGEESKLFSEMYILRPLCGEYIGSLRYLWRAYKETMFLLGKKNGFIHLVM